MGTSSSEIYSINERSADAKLVLTGHAEGDLCGLVTLASAEQFLTASDDGTVKLWDISTKVSYWLVLYNNLCIFQIIIYPWYKIFGIYFIY